MQKLILAAAFERHQLRLCDRRENPVTSLAIVSTPARPLWAIAEPHPHLQRRVIVHPATPFGTAPHDHDRRASVQGAAPVLNLNVLLIALGSAGDVHPFLALGRGLKGRGHRVTLLTNGHFEPVVRRAGLDFIELGTDAEFRAVIDRPEVWDPIGCVRPIIDWVVLGPMRRSFEIIAAHNIPGATVVAAPLTALGARIAQEKLGVPLVTVALYPSLLRSLTHPPALPPLPIARGLPRPGTGSGTG